MENVKIEQRGSELIIRVDLTVNCGPSKSGKTTIIATTSGNHKLADGTVIGLNVYKARS